MRRIFVKSITSIGVVEEPDNGPSAIMLFKRRTAPPADGIAKRLALIDRALRRNRQQTQRVRIAIDKLNRPREEPMNHPTSMSAVDEINRIAHKLTAEDPTLNHAQARAKAWRANPHLVAKSRSQGPQLPRPVETIGERIRYIVDDAARRASWKPLLHSWSTNPDREIIKARLKAEIWRTPEGIALRDLDRLHGGRPYRSDEIAKVAKSRGGATHQRALDLLERGLPIP